MLGWFCCLSIFIFAIGEMICSPTFSAYVGLIAPPDKKALYMGYSNIPFAIGWALGNLLGGFVYEDYGAKANLAMRELASTPQLAAHAARAADWSDSLEKIPTLLKIDRDAALTSVQAETKTDKEATARMLREAFRYDAGQAENMCLQFLALHADYRAKTEAGFAKLLAADAGKLTIAATKLSHEIEERAKEKAATSRPSTSMPVAKESPTDEFDKLLKEMSDFSMLLRGLTIEENAAGRSGVAAYVNRIPAILGIQRAGAMEKARELINKGMPRARWKQDSDIVAMLWQQYGEDPQVLNNLALEYLAQGTGRVETAVAESKFDTSADLKKRAEQLEEQLGINSRKAFAALAAAVAEPTQQKTPTSTAAGEPDDGQVYCELVKNPKDRFEAIAKREWKYDLGFLRELVSSDPEAIKIVRAEIDKQGLLEGLVLRITRIFSPDEYEGEVSDDGINYYKLALKQELVQKALAAKNWTRVPDQARRVMSLNPYEAASLRFQDASKATKMLWDKYHPYTVWYYLGFVGLVGTIGMIIFYFATAKPKTTSQPA
jgi:hypothetical protein